MTTITIDRELLEQALDALSGYRRELGDSQPCDAEQALSAALAAQPPAPAWECKAGGLKKLTQDQYERQTRAIQAHYTRIEPAPAWHDAPTTPGVWVCDEGDICYTWTAHNIEILDIEPEDEVRWYGPIPLKDAK